MRLLLLTICLLPTVLMGNPFPHFNPSTVHTFKGGISSVQTFNLITRPTPHKQILLKTPSGEITVDLGPEWYLDLQNISLYPGEEVEIIGSLIKVNGTHFVIASSITIDGSVYKLRENNGRPVWRGR